MDTHLKDMLGLSSNVPFVWDPAHILQLADKDMREKVPWIEDVCKDMADILSKFAYGKLFEAALDKAREMDIDLKAPLWFSNTRFAAYAHNVFQHFVDNYGVVRSVLEGAASSNTPKSKEAENLLRRIRTIDFIVKLLVCVDFYFEVAKVSKILQQVDLPIWNKSKAIKCSMLTFEEMSTDSTSHFDALNAHRSALEEGEFFGLPVFIKDSGLMTPLRQTRSQDPDHVVELVSDEIQTEITRVLEKGKGLCQAMATCSHKRFPDSFFTDKENKERAASLLPILEAAKKATNVDAFLASEAVVTLTASHPGHTEGVSNLCRNIHSQRESLALCTSDIDVYHHVFTRQELFKEASHVLGKIASIMSSTPPESIVESMGSIIERIKDVRGGSKSSTNKRDVSDISDELLIHWNGPHITQCDSIVKQALNMHFKGGAWHFVKRDIRSKMYKVSEVIDRVRSAKPRLAFMLSK